MKHQLPPLALAAPLVLLCAWPRTSVAQAAVAYGVVAWGRNDSGQTTVPLAGGYNSDDVLRSAELFESLLNRIVNPSKPGDGSFQFSFFGDPSGTNYHVLASPDTAAPLNTWSNLGPATETPPGSGQFQFTDHQAPNSPRRFYRVTSP